MSRYEVHFGWGWTRHCHHPLLRESLESALKSIGYPKWWEIRDRETGQVVASEKIGILPGLGSLLARQILSTLPLLLHGDEYSRVVGDVEVCTDVWSSKDDGETWDLVQAQDSEKSYSPCSVARARGAKPPIQVCGEAGKRITICYTGGYSTVDCNFLELRAKGSLWNLVVLGRTEKGEPSAASKGTLIAGLQEEERDVLVSFGVRVKANGKSLWRKEFFVGDGAQRLGWVRGFLGIDKRQVEVEVGGYKYSQHKYCLTHLASSARLVACKRKTSAERIADVLEMELPEIAQPELSDEAVMRGKALVERVKEEDGWRWDR